MDEYNRQILLDVAGEKLASKGIGKHKRPSFVFNFSPEDFTDYVKTEDELISSMGVYGKTRLRNLAYVGKFCKAYQPITSNYLKTYEDGTHHPVSILPIACTSKYLNTLFEYTRKTSRLLSLCQDIGLLVRVSDFYQFGNRDKSKNTCYYYAYNKSVEHFVIDVCEKRGIDIDIDRERDTIVDKFENDMILSKEDYDRITLRTQHIGVSTCSDEEATRVILAKYKGLILPRQKKILEMNLALPHEQRIRFNPNVKRDARGIISTIGIRATNKIASLKEHENENMDYKGVWRHDYLTEYFDGKPFVGYDVRGSIFKLSHLLNFGEWKSNIIGDDPYKNMFGCDFKRKEDRNAYKLFCYSLYFDRLKQIIWHSNIPNSLKMYGRETINNAIVAAEASMRQYTGDKFFNEVFLHESLLYIDFVYELRRRGIGVVQVYDGFYLKQGAISELELDSLMQKCAMKYYEDYKAWMSKGEVFDYRVAA